jgi:hypothetical protein
MTGLRHAEKFRPFSAVTFIIRTGACVEKSRHHRKSTPSYDFSYGGVFVL